MRTHVDLFSGIGGFSLACEWAGVETIAFSEIDSYASRVLKRHFPNIKNYGDVRNVPALDAWLVTAGVPCQPASIAGRRRGAADDRWLWPEAIAAVERCKPAWICLENPLGILSLEQPVMSIDLEGYGNLIEEAIRREGDSWAVVTGEVEFIFRDLIASVEKLGYEVAPVVIPACGVGALHRRYRVWIMGHATSVQSRPGQQSTRDNEIGSTGSRDVSDPNGRRAHTESKRLRERDNEANTRRDGEVRPVPKPARVGRGEGRPEPDNRRKTSVGEYCGSFANTNRKPQGRITESWGERDQWAVEPNVGRVANGIPARVDRLRGLGNAIVPQVAYQLIKRMIEAEEQCRYDQ